MIISNLINTTAEILKVAIKSSQPTDQIVSKILREKKFIGSKERKFISETVFASLRNLTLLENCNKPIQIENPNSSVSMILNTLLISDSDYIDTGYSAQKLLSLIYPNKNIIIKELITELMLNNFELTIDDVTNWITNTDYVVNELAKSLNIFKLPEYYDIISNFYSCAPWILENVHNQGYDPSELAKSLVLPAKVCLRLTEKGFEDKIHSMLDIKAIPYHKSQMIPDCIILDKRAKLDDTDEYKNGMIEIQDEGSQLIAYALAPKGVSTVLDACAGAGGKTLHIASINPLAQITASDAEYLRIKEFAKRLRRYNRRDINIKHAKTMHINHLTNLFGGMMFDYILIDAPCTGLGTARRDPLKKLRVTQKLAEKMQTRQLQILEAYSKLLKPGGIMVYATCSLVTTENQETVTKFLESNLDFVTDNLYDVLNEQGISPIGMKPDDYSVSLMPHIHGTDGFYMARMKRIE
ncbi:MAG: RsmB/NOP family class I SAM-dependent RNA methyltransferase [Candidatus Kapabacteria bacterium]|nr:RsmB/NOP family class I SAM-dependent RNA methyltransferase [Ignavibacteriota bacterium]MCW5886008.1 RsmB/NOP family class I SAM-dependent RNA methyltransferase [Candidatus Kapabacteria bacterium]